MLGKLALVGLTTAGIAMGAWRISPAAAAGDDWSTFHYDAQHTGVSLDTTIGASSAASLAVQWSAPIGGGSSDPGISSPVVVYNATLGKTLVYVVSLNGIVRAYDTTGAAVWTSPQNIGGGAVVTPAVDANSLYVGSDNGVLTALDATTGALQCSYTLPVFAPETVPGRIEDAPVVGHDSTGLIVYFGDTGESESVNHGHEWAINGVGNTSGQCTLKWSHDIGTTGGKKNGSWSPPALVTDSTGRPLVVFGTNQPDDAVYALDARDGSQVWRFQTLKNFSDADVGAGPTISAPGVENTDGIVYIDGKDKQEYALDLLSGTQLWTFDLESDSTHSTNSVSCAALAGNLLVVAYWKYVYAFNATTGLIAWRSVASAGNTLGSVSISGAQGDQVVLRGDLSGDEYAYRLSDGFLLKTVKVSSAALDSSTAVADGKAFITGVDGNVYALGVTSSGNQPVVSGVSPSGGTTTGGTSVTISGSNFTGVTGVSFGGSPATYSFVSDSTVTATSPGGSGTVDVRVTTGNGTSAITSADQFTYTSGSTPVVTSISPTSGPAAGNTTVTINGVNFTGVTGVAFGTTTAAYTFVSDAKITATSPAGSGTVDVRVTTGSGTSAITPADQFSYTSGSAPVVTSVSPSSGPKAGGTLVTIMGSNFTGATQCTFGGKVAAFTVVSDTEITCTSPGGKAGPVNVLVHTPAGTSLKGHQFTYV